MALRRITMSSGEPDVTVSFVFKVHTKKNMRITQCKLFIREDKTDAPHLIFWGREERMDSIERNPKLEQWMALENAFSNFYSWVLKSWETIDVPGIYNAVLSHRQAIMFLFEENWKKQMKNTQRGRSRK